MSVEAAPIIITVATRAPRRPYLSPTWPKMSAPTGRAMNAALKLRNAETVEATGSLPGKNSGAKTIAAVVPKRKKSYHSSAVPMKAAATTLPGLDGAPAGTGGAGAGDAAGGRGQGSSLLVILDVSWEVLKWRCNVEGL